MKKGMIRIKVIDPKKPDQVQELDLQPETTLNQECLIGRFSNCDVVLDGAEVSRMHGKIFKRNAHYYFADLASRGGSRMNGENVQLNQEYPLQQGDMIQIGRFFLMVSSVPSPEGDTIVETNTQATSSNHQRVETQPVRSPNKVAAPPPVTTPSVPPEEYMPVAMADPSQLQRWSKGELTVRCISVIDETHDVKTFRFIADPPVLFTYKPGQFVTLDLEINGEQISRSYSISSTPSRPHTLEITVKRVPAPPNTGTEVPRGLVSNWLHDNIKVGSTIKISGPLGKFTCFANPSQKLLFISAGSGITPMMSMSRWICDTGANCDVVFFHCARSPRDIIYREELEIMSARYLNFHLAVSTTRRECGYGWFSLTGRLDSNMLQLIAPDFLERTVFVCGPEAFMESTKQLLESLGFPMQNYHEESFGGPPKKKSKVAPTKESAAVSGTETTATAPRPGLKDMFRNLPSGAVANSNGGSHAAGGTQVSVQAPSAPKSTSSSQTAVVFSKSGKEVPCDGEDSILDLAEQQGIKIRSSCRSGVCGSCKKRKLEGEIRYEGDPEGLEDSEREEGYVLTCISYPVGRVVVDA